jgi:hypothetical protein
MSDRWMSCSACRKDIAFASKHFVCSVSTCNRARTRLVFCSVPCWDSHVAVLRHRDAWAVEAYAPTRAEWDAREPDDELTPPPTRAPAPPAPSPSAFAPSAPAPSAPVRRVMAPAPAPGPAPSTLSLGAADESDILIVVSKMKKYIRDRSGMNTSDSVAAALSDHVRAICDLAIRSASAEGRKTVLDRDVPPVRR